MNITAGLDKVTSDTYGFVYVTTNHVNDKRYVGQKKIDKKGAWKDYIGSGVILSRAVEKYGRNSFTKEIVDVATDANELNEKEIYWISTLNAVEDDGF